MNKNTTARKRENHELSSLTENARALIAATADVAGDKVVEARQRLSDAVDSVRDQVVEGAKSADEAIRENPYTAISISLTVGVLIGVLITRRKSRD